MFTQNPMGKSVDNRENESPKYGHPETVHFKTFHHSAQEPEKETVDDESENTKREKVER